MKERAQRALKIWRIKQKTREREFSTGTDSPQWTDDPIRMKSYKSHYYAMSHLKRIRIKMEELSMKHVDAADIKSKDKEVAKWRLYLEEAEIIEYDLVEVEQKERRQRWFCEECKVSAVVEYVEGRNSDVWSVKNAISESHRNHSEECHKEYGIEFVKCPQKDPFPDENGEKDEAFDELLTKKWWTPFNLSQMVKVKLREKGGIWTDYEYIKNRFALGPDSDGYSYMTGRQLFSMIETLTIANIRWEQMLEEDISFETNSENPPG